MRSALALNIAAKFQGQACADWMGEEGAGHFVKAVHNGMEYAAHREILRAVARWFGAGRPCDFTDIRAMEQRRAAILPDRDCRESCRPDRCCNRPKRHGPLDSDRGAATCSAFFAEKIKASHDALRQVVAIAAQHGQPVPAHAAALAYFDGMRTARGTANMIQGQRDFFGLHGFARLDDGTSGNHGPWAQA
jgi:6-phosphogluconate dehydrogenase